MLDSTADRAAGCRAGRWCCWSQASGSRWGSCCSGRRLVHMVGNICQLNQGGRCACRWRRRRRSWVPHPSACRSRPRISRWVAFRHRLFTANGPTDPSPTRPGEALPPPCAVRTPPSCAPFACSAILVWAWLITTCPPPPGWRRRWSGWAPVLGAGLRRLAGLAARVSASVAPVLSASGSSRRFQHRQRAGSLRRAKPRQNPAGGSPPRHGRHRRRPAPRNRG